MKPSNETLDPILEGKLAAFRVIPERDRAAAATGRAAFLAEAQALSARTSRPPAVPAARPQRLNSWKDNLTNLFRRKERSYMPIILSTLLVLSLLAGGAGATVFAAQDNLPGQGLYSLKTLSEDLRLGLTADPETQLALSLEFANRRIAEWGLLVKMGEALPEDSLQRYEYNLDQALAAAAGMDNAALALAIQKLTAELGLQVQNLEQLAKQPDSSAEAMLVRAREMVRERFRWVEAGRTNPAAFREQVRRHTAEHKAGGTPPTGWGEGYGPGRQATMTPTPGGDGYGPGPLATNTPTPGGGYGPGPGPDPSRTPGGDHGYGPRPAEPTHTPGGGHGPGPGPDPSRTPPPGGGDCAIGPCPTHTPDGGHHGHGPTATPGPGDGGGNGPGPNPSPGPTDDHGAGDGGGSGPGPNPSLGPADDHGPGEGGGGGHS